MRCYSQAQGEDQGLEGWGGGGGGGGGGGQQSVPRSIRVPLTLSPGARRRHRRCRRCVRSAQHTNPNASAPLLLPQPQHASAPAAAAVSRWLARGAAAGSRQRSLAEGRLAWGEWGYCRLKLATTSN